MKNNATNVFPHFDLINKNKYKGPIYLYIFTLTTFFFLVFFLGCATWLVGS